MSGCKDLTGAQSLPSGVNDPAYFSTPSGAIGMRNSAKINFRDALLVYVIASGLVSDELGLAPDPTHRFFGEGIASLDQRILQQQQLGAFSSEFTGYGGLQRVRGGTNQAIGALAAYYPTASPALRGEMYALQGYAEIMLADFFCSGIPLSTLDFQADYTYHAGSKKEDVYKDAIAKFDTALAISTDSTQIMNLARVGLGRAYLALGQYAQAAQAVASVPDGYQYQMIVQWAVQNPNNGEITNLINYNNGADVSNAEGVNGLPFLSSGDPRTIAVNTVTAGLGLPVHFPAKYQTGLTYPFYSPIVVADWIEVRLIRAEAALAANDPTTWLSQLNYLRQNARVSGQTGTLPQLTDPGSPAARVSLLFQERAYWLYMTGHRQGDLRRLIRQYGRSQSAIYPTGDYLPAGGQGTYGNDVTVPISSSDESPNPLFHGCIDRNA
jgi:tetratricopeptide (TPR) repeat protein